MSCFIIKQASDVRHRNTEKDTLIKKTQRKRGSKLIPLLKLYIPLNTRKTKIRGLLLR